MGCPIWHKTMDGLQAAKACVDLLPWSCRNESDRTGRWTGKYRRHHIWSAAWQGRCACSKFLNTDNVKLNSNYLCGQFTVPMLQLLAAAGAVVVDVAVVIAVTVVVVVVTTAITAGSSSSSNCRTGAPGGLVASIHSKACNGKTKILFSFWTSHMSVAISPQTLTLVQLYNHSYTTSLYTHNCS